MKTAVLVGGSSSLGQALAALFLADRSWRVVSAGRTLSEDVEQLVDVGLKSSIQALMEEFKPSLIINLVATFGADFAESYQLNVLSTKLIFETIQHLNYSCRVVTIGSAAEYGVVAPQDNPISETRVLKPVSVYGLTKSWQTLLAYQYSHQGVDTVNCRVFNLIGPSMSSRLFVGSVQQQICLLKSGQANKISVGPLGAIRDYLSTKEAAAQILAIAKFGKTGETYNVGSGHQTSMRHLLESMLISEGLTLDCVEEASLNSIRKGYDVPVIFADMAKTNDVLGKVQY
jgi:nucleoside-diphosphate-sugar epimerase